MLSPQTIRWTNPAIGFRHELTPLRRLLVGYYLSPALPPTQETATRSGCLRQNLTSMQRKCKRIGGGRIDPAHVAHLSPLGWDHINLTGDYVWSDSIERDPDGLLPLRLNAEPAYRESVPQ